MSEPVLRLLAGVLAPALAVGLAVTAPASAAPEPTTAGTPPKIPTSVGYGGAVSSVDPNASAIGLRVLRQGGNAVDAAVATASALGVTEPYSAGIGGGGYFLYYDARSRRVHTLDGRETAPRRMPSDAFLDPETGEPYPFFPERVTSGVSVGTPGTPATWEQALQRWGSWSLSKALRPSIRLARRGFVVDETFRQQTVDNVERFGAFSSSSELFLPDGEAPEVGSRFRNRDLAATLSGIARAGTRQGFYTGELAREMVAAVQAPPTVDDTDLPVPPGFLSRSDLSDYRVRAQRPTRVAYRDYDVFGMAPSSSGGSTVGEALNILETYRRLDRMRPVAALHRYLEASALAFADRGAYLGDLAYVDVPLRDLLSQRFARERACEIDPRQAAVKPVPAQGVDDYDGRCDDGEPTAAPADDTEGPSTTNLTVADRWGNVVEYTLTIEQTGGSGIVVPGRGFLLNNELTDFSAVVEPEDPNRIQPGKRPRSSMSPTIVLRDGKPFLALGTPGGSTIITTVLQILLNRIDLGMGIEEALAAPRATQRNTSAVIAEPSFIDVYGRVLQRRFGHTLEPAGDGLTSAAEIGAATAIEFSRRGRLTAVAEPERRGGGAAYVVSERRTPR